MRRGPWKIQSVSRDAAISSPPTVSPPTRNTSTQAPNADVWVSVPVGSQVTGPGDVAQAVASSASAARLPWLRPDIPRPPEERIHPRLLTLVGRSECLE